MQILVIEDDATLNEQLCGLLADNGYDSVPAKSEKEAEDVLNKHGSSIAIALVDMFLPAKAVDLDAKESGLRLIHLMTQRYPSIVKVILTAYGDLANATKCMEAGAFSYCTKDCKPLELLGKIRKAETKFRREQSLGNGIHGLHTEVEKVRESLSNLISSIERLSDEFYDASGNNKQFPTET
jgi:DNA-binding NtrC family response regulator